MTGCRKALVAVAVLAMLAFGVTALVRAERQGAPSPSPAKAPLQAAASPAAEHRALLDQYCVTCHNQRVKAAGLTLDTLDAGDLGSHGDAWEKVVRKLRAGQMPPSGMPRPPAATIDRLSAWLEAGLDRAAAAHPDPGRTQAFHRLNRAEYRNVVRDLLAVDFDALSLLPADDATYGFDNIATALRIDSSRMEQYLSAATTIARAAVGDGQTVPAWTTFKVRDDVPQYGHIEGLPFGTRGGTLADYDAPRDAEYVIRIKLLCKGSGGCDPAAGFDDVHELELGVDGERVKLFTVEPHWDVKEPVFEVRLPLRAGPRQIAVAFLKQPSFQEVEAIQARHLRPFLLGSGEVGEQYQAIYQPFVDSVTIGGPFNATGAGDTPSRRRLFVCRPARGREPACAKQILSTVARRAFRRPIADEDLRRLMASYETAASEGFERGIEEALTRLLVSPEFLFRIERDPEGAAGAYAISDLELASRLSFFLWSSMPDDELLDLAIGRKLATPQVLEQQVGRLLRDARAEAFVGNFAGQWLQLRNLDAALPSVLLFPDFDGLLRESFRRETELFFASVLQERRSVLELLTANYTFLNERLARHYGVPNVYGSQFRRVTLDDEKRRGLFGQGSILTVTSRPNRTSPVLRGKWILENILGTPPPDPPANVPPFQEREEGAKGAMTMRDRMARHRSNPACSGCHSMIDPLGFALENFDAIGRWRDVDERYASVDTSGLLPDGSAFTGIAEFRAAVLRRPELFATTVTGRMLTYALGRAPEYYDMPTVRRIVRDAAPGGFRLADLIGGIVRSDPFLKRAIPRPDSAERVAMR